MSCKRNIIALWVCAVVLQLCFLQGQGATPATYYANIYNQASTILYNYCTENLDETAVGGVSEFSSYEEQCYFQLIMTPQNCGVQVEPANPLFLTGDGYYTIVVRKYGGYTFSGVLVYGAICV